MKKLNVTVVIFFLLILCGCKDHTEIVQEVHFNYDYHENAKDHIVVTKVWIINWIGFPVSLPLWEIKSASINGLDAIKYIEMQKAIEVQKRIQQKYGIK